MRVLGIIPARYHSTRLEGKPLVDIAGKTMIHRVYEQSCKAIDTVYIATDDIRIYDAAKTFGARVVMTSSDHTNGTSRCLEAAESIISKSQNKNQYIINIQGDEPLIEPLQIKELINTLSQNTPFATLVKSVEDSKDLCNPSECFVVVNERNEAMYFSRTPIPHVRGVEIKDWLAHHTFYKHVGIYGYTYEALKTFSCMKTSSLEQVESLEQNRWIQAGKIIKIGYTHFKTIPVDTLEDLTYVRHILKNKTK